MDIQDVTQRSKNLAKKHIERDGGFLVPIYAVVKTDTDGRVQSVTHDHLDNVHYINTDK